MQIQFCCYLFQKSPPDGHPRSQFRCLFHCTGKKMLTATQVYFTTKCSMYLRGSFQKLMKMELKVYFGTTKFLDLIHRLFITFPLTFWGPSPKCLFLTKLYTPQEQGWLYSSLHFYCVESIRASANVQTMEKIRNFLLQQNHFKLIFCQFLKSFFLYY